MRTDTKRTPYTRAACCGLFLTGLLLFTLLTLPTAATAQVDTLWSENWEGDFTDNWFTDAGTWEVGMPTSGPGSAYEGQNVSATVLAGNYSDFAPDSRLIRFTTFVVPAASENPRLRFWHWFNWGGGDYGRVEVSSDGGSTWNAVSPDYSSNGSGTWTYPLLDLSVYAEQEVQLAFFFHADGGGNDPGPGWYVDEVAVITGPYTFNNPEGWESGLGDWYADLGTWEVGAPASGPGSARTGEQVAATVLGGNYSDFAPDSRLISPIFTIPDASGSPRLEFWHWFNFGGGDFVEIQLRTTGGEWATLAGPFSSNSSGVWTFFTTPLSLYAEQDVQFAFLFHADGGGNDPGPGWFIDDIEVTGLAVSTEPQNATGSFALRSAYPNPSAASTTVAFDLPEAAEVTIRVFDVLGREVGTVTPGLLSAGAHQLPWQAAGLASGVYLYRVEARMPSGTEMRSGRLTVMQ